MSGEDSELRYQLGHAFDDKCLLVATSDGTVANDTSTTVLMVSPEGLEGNLPTTAWPTIAICTLPWRGQDQTIINVGLYGHIQVYRSGRVSDASLPIEHEVAFRARGARRIGNKAFVVGTSRQVFAMGPTAFDWNPLYEGLGRPDEYPESHFNAIDGFEHRLLVVGSGGQIWHRAGSRWKPLASPVQSDLLDIIRLENRYFACGQDGTLLEGDESGFDRIGIPTPPETLTRLAVFKDRLYVTGENRIHRLQEGRLEPVSTPLELVQPGLTASEKRIWIASGSDILTSTDGEAWTRLRLE